MLNERLLRVVIREILNEGGNATAHKLGSGEEIQRELPDGSFEPRTAQRIPLKDIGRDELMKVLDATFTAMNVQFKQIHGDDLWPGGYRPSKHLFSGSSSFLYDANICTTDLCDVKPTLGDIDVMIPNEKLQQVWELLNHYQNSGQQIINNVKFIGCTSTNTKGAGDNDQLNCTFEYTMKSGDTVDMQIDFERATFTAEDDGQATTDWFSRFAHGSSFDDMRQGMKGFAHKLLLRSLYTGSSMIDGTMVTPSSTVDNPKIAMRFSKSQGKKVPKQGASRYGFAVTHGLRQLTQDFGTHPEYGALLKSMPAPSEIKKKNLMIAKKNAKNGTNVPMIPDAIYEKEFDKLIIAAFPEIEPSPENQEKFSSFVGLIDLMKSELSQQEIDKTFSSFMSKLLGSRAQILYRNNPTLEIKEKAAPLTYFMKNLQISPELKDEFSEKMKQHKIRVTSGENLDVSV